MKKSIKIGLIILFSASCIHLAKSDVTEERQTLLIDEYLEKMIDKENNCGTLTKSNEISAYALCALILNRNQSEIDNANAYLQSYVVDFDVDGGGTEDPSKPGFAGYFEMPIIARIYADFKDSSLLTNTTKSALEDYLWEFISYRHGNTDLDAGTTWKQYNSENKNNIERTSFLLACETLMESNSYGTVYGPSTVLPDGKTIKQYRDGLHEYYIEYFRQRAREGTNYEVGSPAYVKMTFANYANIYDFVTSAAVKNAVGNYLSLYLSTVATEYSNYAGGRGGGSIRHQKKYIVGNTEHYSTIFYVYDWTETRGPTNPAMLPWIDCSYRPPAIVDEIGKDIDRPQSLGLSGYMNSSRIWGRGFSNAFNNALFEPDNSANTRRDTWVHRDYNIGGFTFDLTEDQSDYIPGFQQDRAMGIYFNSNRGNRVMFHGKGASNDKSYLDINGVVGENVLVASRALTERDHGTETWIYLDEGALQDNQVDDSGWIFTKTNVPNYLLPGDVTLTPSTIPDYNRDGFYNQALEFDGVDDIAYAENKWVNYDSVSVDFYFKTDDAAGGEQVMVNAVSTWQVSLANDDLKFIVWINGGARTLTLSNAVSADTWYYVTASVDSSGNMSVELDDGLTVLSDSSSGAPMRLRNKNITLGEKPSSNRHFNGMLDEVVITVPSSGELIADWPMEETEEVFVGIYIGNGTSSLKYAPTIYEITRNIIDPCTGQVTGTSTQQSNMIELEDQWSPVVLQTGAAADYGYDFAAFKTSVKANFVSYASGKLTYTSEAGETFEMWANSTTLPKKGGVDIDLNPDKVYDSPIVQGYHGLNSMTISYTGYADLELDFSYDEHRQWDDYQTVALWHMDALVGGDVEDDTRGNAAITVNRSANNLELLGGTALTTGDGGKFDEALSFDGVDDWAKAANAWSNSFDCVRVEAWIRPDDVSGANVIVAADTVWKVELNNGKLKFVTWNSSSSATSLTWPASLSASTWHHFVAICLEDGTMQLSVNGAEPMEATVTSLRSLTKDIELADKPGTNRWYDGLIDDLKISRPYIK